MSTQRSRRCRVARVLAVALVGAASLGACGGGGSGTGRTPAAPAASIDPSSDNVITGPVNRARAAADAQEAHDRQVEQTGDGQRH